MIMSIWINAVTNNPTVIVYAIGVLKYPTGRRVYESVKVYIVSLTSRVKKTSEVITRTVLRPPQNLPFIINGTGFTIGTSECSKVRIRPTASWVEKCGTDISEAVIGYSYNLSAAIYRIGITGIAIKCS